MSIFISAHLISPAGAQETSFSLYGGPGASAPLTNVLRLREMGLEPFHIVTGALARRLGEGSPVFSWEAEGQVTWHSHGGPFAINGALIGRFLRPPWASSVGGSFGIGAGLSYAFGIPPLEKRELAHPSRTLIYLLFEYEIGLGEGSPWAAILRIHHRSGGFGLVGKVTGGSDYLCLGAKYRW